jgi:lipase maturation factor 1
VNEANGAAAEPPLGRVAAGFLRALGGVYACAFLSLWVQLSGLIGAHGIAPAAELLSYARDRVGAGAPLVLPSLLWLTGASDWALHALCLLGVTASALLVLGRFPLAAAGVAWLAYLSLTSVGDVFLGFQWDALLLETGVVALFVASGEPRLGVWLARLLLLKLMVLSGAVKLTSGDSTWRDGSALVFHFWTQPLPLPTSWAVEKLPDAALHVATWITIAVELLAPWGMLGPRRVRLASAALLVSLQLLIASTGNYGFFNLLTLVLCGCLLDDRDFARWLTPRPATARWVIPRRIAAGILAFASVTAGLERVTPPRLFPSPLRAMLSALAPFRSTNSYGLFAVMTTERPEIELEGSSDGREWRPYVFRWKADDPSRMPRFAGPHMPRVDWQMWFAGLSDCQREPWFQRMLERLLEGSETVSDLLARNPFPGDPPRYLRTTLWRYRLSHEPGAWWTRREAGSYCPIVTLREGRLAVANDVTQ